MRTARSRRPGTFEHSGHFGHIEEPEEFASAVAGFVERNVAAG
jgi:pimeloyl-ACP methyl ester carboxylesterase